MPKLRPALFKWRHSNARALFARCVGICRSRFRIGRRAVAAAFTMCQLTFGVIPSPKISPNLPTRRKVPPVPIAADAIQSSMARCVHRRHNNPADGSRALSRRGLPWKNRAEDGSETEIAKRMRP